MLGFVSPLNVGERALCHYRYYNILIHIFELQDMAGLLCSVVAYSCCCRTESSMHLELSTLK